MKQLPQLLGSIFSVFLVLLLAIPTIQWLAHFHLFSERKVLYGYVDKPSEKPRYIMKAYFDRSLQHWLEEYFNINLGLRTFMIKTFNEINFRLFHENETVRLRVISTPKHGLYSNLTVDSLNNEIMHRKNLEMKYQREADKLLKIQKILEARGKYFQVVIASSKAYIYPDELGKRYLSGGPEGVFERAVSFGKILKALGVNVIDSGPELRQLAKQKGLETHPASGLHWNYFAGCLVAHEIFENFKMYSPQYPVASINCGAPQRAMPLMNDVDVDGYLLLNVWSDAGLLKLSTYPTVSLVEKPTWRPKIVFIGDSFSDHIRHFLKKEDVYSQIVMSSYFQTREIDDRILGSGLERQPEQKEVSAIQSELIKDIAESDIIILEMVDYNVLKESLFSFSDYFLKNAEKVKVSVHAKWPARCAPRNDGFLIYPVKAYKVKS